MTFRTREFSAHCAGPFSNVEIVIFRGGRLQRCYAFGPRSRTVIRKIAGLSCSLPRARYVRVNISRDSRLYRRFHGSSPGPANSRPPVGRVLSTTERPSRSLEAPFYIPPNDETEPEGVEGRAIEVRVAGPLAVPRFEAIFVLSQDEVKRTVVGTRERRRRRRGKTGRKEITSCKIVAGDFSSSAKQPWTSRRVPSSSFHRG